VKSSEDDPKIVWLLIATMPQDEEDKNVYMI
jgi:hypothetical protein